MTVDLAYQVAGPGSGAPTVVLLGSLGSNRGMWEPQVGALSAVFEVVAVDLRGHGESFAPPGPYTIEELAGDVLALIDRLDRRAVHLVGLSLGGAIAQWIAAHAPDRVLSLTLLCTAAKFGAPQGWLDRAAAVRADGTASIAEAVVGRWFTAGLAERDPALVARSRAMIEATDDEGYAACCEAISTWDGRADLPRISAPTLVLAGAQDPATPLSDLRLISEGIANSQLRELDPAAHLASVEQAGPVCALIAAHVAGAERRSPIANGSDPTGTTASSPHSALPVERAAAYEAGMRMRRSVLGDAHVDRAVAGTTEFTAPFQDFITRTAWGDVWSRPGLDQHTRRLLTLAILTALGNTHELDMHIRAALRAGVAAEELAEVFLHTAIYAGVPNSNLAFGLGKAALAEGAGSTDEEEPHRP
ncbi:bifunctional 3-oxoadipate enol-lactonase/4-carboxymuconolactone decarboxylase PcaDC [Nocardia goodfellowii]